MRYFQEYIRILLLQKYKVTVFDIARQNYKKLS